MDGKQVIAWIEAHPGESVIIGGVSLIAVIWLFGGFSSSAAPADNSASTLAAAYYTAEAQQAVVGGQIQEANIAANASTAQALIGASAATQINQQNTTASTSIIGTEAGAATTINQQNTGAATTINQQNVSGAVQATQINADAATSMNANNNAAFLSGLTTQANAQEALSALSTIVPQEIATSGGFGNFFLPGGQNISVNTGFAPSPADYAASGFSPTTATQLSLLNMGFNPGSFQPQVQPLAQLSG